MGVHKATEGSSRESTNELVSHIYRMAADPNAYDGFMERWAAYVAAAMRDPSGLESNSGSANPMGPFEDVVSQHFQMGFQLLGQLGRKNVSGNPDEFDDNRAAILAGADGRIVWFNGAAASTFGVASTWTIDSLPLTVPSKQSIARAQASLRERGENAAPHVVQMTARDGRTALMELSVAFDSMNQPNIVLRELRQGWRREAAEILRKDLSMTTAEIDVVRLLAEGESVQEIAEAKSNSVETIRIHVKSALAKTGARNQAELVRTTMTILRFVEHTARDRPSLVQTPAETLDITANGRSIPIDIYGDPSGRPVIYFHGMLDGCSVTRHMNNLLVERGLKLIVPFRPSYGPAGAAAASVENVPNVVAADMVEIAANLRIERAVLLGHLAGSIYAFASAATLGDRVIRIVNVGGCVPVVSTDQISQMSTRQRLVAWTGRHAPALLPFILRAGIRLLDSGGEEMFARALYKSSKPDRDLLDDPETYQIIARGFRLAVAQGHRAFQTDGWHVIRDWSTLVNRTAIPVDLVHGEYDPVVSLRSVRSFAERLGDRAKLEAVRGSGQLVLHSNPERVALALAHAHDCAR